MNLSEGEGLTAQPETQEPRMIRQDCLGFLFALDP